MSLKSINNIHGSHSFPPGMLSVGNSIPNDVSQEAREDVSDFLINVKGDSLDTSSSGEPSDSRLGDAFDKRSGRLLGVSLDADFSDAFSAFSSFSDASHLLFWEAARAL